MSGSSGDEAAQTLATFLDGMPTPKERLNAAIRALLDERGQRNADTNLGAGSSQMGPDDEAVAIAPGSNEDLTRILTHHGVSGPDDGGQARSVHFMPGGTTRLLDDLIRWRNAAAEGLAGRVCVLLDEREQLLEAGQLAEAQLTEIGSERAEWKARAQRGDVVAKILRTDLGNANARAKQAEAEVERLKVIYLNAIDIEKRLARERIANELERAAELGYPHNAAWNQDLYQAAHIARDGLEAWFADDGRGPDGKRLDGQRQPWEPIRDQQDVDDLAAAPEDRLSPEEAAEFLKNIAECRGGERYADEVNAPIAAETVQALKDALISGSPARYRSPQKSVPAAEQQRQDGEERA